MYFQEQVIKEYLNKFLRKNNNIFFSQCCKNGVNKEVINIIYNIAQETNIELGEDRIKDLKPIIQEVIDEYINASNGILIA